MLGEEVVGMLYSVDQSVGDRHFIALVCEGLHAVSRAE